MSYSSDLTQERILSCAKSEFMARGFLKANMRTIAKNAKVTTGAMYNHFKNKELLFEALVGETATESMRVFEKEHIECVDLPSFFDGATEQASSRGLKAILDYIYAHFEEITLLVCHSASTKYEDFVEKMIRIEEETTLQMFKNQGYSLSETDNFLAHVISSSSISNMLEAVRHNLSREEANSYIEKLHVFFYAGWKAILK